MGQGQRQREWAPEQEECTLLADDYDVGERFVVRIIGKTFGWILERTREGLGSCQTREA